MPRIRRFLQDGLAYHVLNRGNRRSAIFHQPADYLEFLTTMVDAMAVVPMRVLAFCLLSNHFHLVLWPDDAHDLSTYMRCFMNRHVRRYHARHGTWGSGHLYQGRFKSFPIQTGEHLLTVLRYVEANAVKAGLASEFPNDTAQIVKFGRTPVLLIRTDTGLFRAFSATCTHLDCIVQYRADLKHIWCACHNGHYDLQGRTLSGPPPRPLPLFAVDVVNDEIIVSKPEQVG